MRIMFIVIALATISSCGKAPGASRSSDDIKAITDTFVAGTTTISAVYDKLGIWNEARSLNNYGVGDVRNDEYVIYKTSDGGETKVTFAYTCDAGFPNCKDDTSSDLGKAHLLYSGTTHTN